MTDYSQADAVKAIAAELVPLHHRHLIGHRVEFVWRDTAAKKAGKVVLGRARKISGLNAFLAREDQTLEGEGVPDFFVIEIAEDEWGDLREPQRVALVDHELSHCAVMPDEDGLLKLSMAPHDCEEFCSVVERHGLWRPDVTAFVHAARAVQLELIPGGRRDIRDVPEAQVAALAEVLRGVDASADDALAMSLLDRRLAASVAGLDDVADSTWTLVVQALRVADFGATS